MSPAQVPDPRDRLGADPSRHAPPGWDGLTRRLQAAQQQAAAPWPISRTCSTEFTALHHSGRRPVSSIGLVVVHCTQGSTARGAASWFANPDSRGSAHLCVDRVECYRTLPPSIIPWGAIGANTRGWHLELAGFAQWERSQWLAHRGTIERGAYKTALHCRAFGIPPRFLSDRELRAGKRGIVSHRGCCRVFGGDHTDPGRWFPWDVYLRRTLFYYNQGV